MENEKDLINALLLTISAFVKKYGKDGAYTFTKEEITAILEDNYEKKYVDLNYEDSLKVEIITEDRPATTV